MGDRHNMSEPGKRVKAVRKVCEVMYCENMPLYPGMRPPCDPSPCMKVRLFDDGCCGGRRGVPMREHERVMIDNPCRPGERAEVTLGVDDCGNLVICVHRLCRQEPPCRSGPCDPWPQNCLPEPCPPRRPRRRHRPDWVCCR